MNPEREMDRLRHVRRRLHDEAERLMLEYAWLRVEGLQLHQRIQPTRPTDAKQLLINGHHFIETYQRLEAESEQFHTACEQYLRDSLRIQEVLKPHLQPDEVWSLHF